MQITFVDLDETLFKTFAKINITKDGSWKESDLKEIVATDGVNKMIDVIEFDNVEIIDDWLSDKKADTRKEYIVANDFSIAKL